MADRAALEDRDIRCAAANVDHAGAEIALVRQQRRVARRQTLQDQLVDLKAAGLDALVDVLRGRDRDGDAVHLSIESLAMHSDWIVIALTTINAALSLVKETDFMVVRKLLPHAPILN